MQIEKYKKNIKDIGTGDIPKGAKFIEIAIKNFSEIYPIEIGLKFLPNQIFLQASDSGHLLHQQSVFSKHYPNY